MCFSIIYGRENAGKTSGKERDRERGRKRGNERGIDKETACNKNECQQKAKITFARLVLNRQSATPTGHTQPTSLTWAICICRWGNQSNYCQWSRRSWWRKDLRERDRREREREAEAAHQLGCLPRPTRCALSGRARESATHCRLKWKANIN